MTHGSLFSGIGGFDLAAEWMGWENKFHCEWNEFGKKVLSHYWPSSKSYHDIRESDFTEWRGKIGVLSGGFPCQPFSFAGKRKGTEDERHLFPEMLRAIREIQPRWIVGENVLGIVNWSGGMVFEEVCSDLEAEGYEVQPYILPSAGKNAPHRRDRVWFIAHTYNNRHYPDRGKEKNKGRIQKKNREKMGSRIIDRASLSSTTTNSGSTESQRGEFYGSTKKERKIKSESRQFSGSVSSKWEEFPTQSPICSGDDGIPGQLDGITVSKWKKESIKAYGNAIVPQVAFEIFKAIEAYEHLNNKT